jgi:internalin A
VGALAACRQLRELFLYSTRLANVEPLGALSELRALHLFGTPVRDVAALAACANLRTLNLSGTLVAAVGPLGACHRLRQLDLHGAQHVADLRGLGRLSALTSLSLDSTRVCDVRELATCAALEVKGPYATVP